MANILAPDAAATVSFKPPMLEADTVGSEPPRDREALAGVIEEARIAANDLPEYHLTIYGGARGDPCLHAVRRTLLSPGHQAHDIELLHDVGKRRTRMRA